jgi:hypothetical protein
MRHLTPEELLDLAEGSRPLSSAPHLTACEVCRQQLDELRGAMATLDADGSIFRRGFARRSRPSPSPRARGLAPAAGRGVSPPR